MLLLPGIEQFHICVTRSIDTIPTKLHKPPHPTQHLEGEKDKSFPYNLPVRHTGGVEV